MTNVSPATFRTTYNIEKSKSTQGHIIIRVLDGGKKYYVVNIDDTNESMKVKSVFGPYESK